MHILRPLAILALSPVLVLSCAAEAANVFYCGSAGDADIYAEVDNHLARSYVVMSGEYAAETGGASVTKLEHVSGTIYEGDDQKLVVIGNQAEFSDPSGSYSCSLSSKAELDRATSSVTFPDEGPFFSWGGKLRSGPSITAEQTDSLQMGEKVTLLERTEDMYQGFPWFKVATENAMIGYTWGGILCDQSGRTDGMFNENNCQ